MAERAASHVVNHVDTAGKAAVGAAAAVYAASHAVCVLYFEANAVCVLLFKAK